MKTSLLTIFISLGLTAQPALAKVNVLASSLEEIDHIIQGSEMSNSQLKQLKADSQEAVRIAAKGKLLTLGSGVLWVAALGGSYMLCPLLPFTVSGAHAFVGATFFFGIPPYMTTLFLIDQETSAIKGHPHQLAQRFSALSPDMVLLYNGEIFDLKDAEIFVKFVAEFYGLYVNAFEERKSKVALEKEAKDTKNLPVAEVVVAEAVPVAEVVVAEAVPVAEDVVEDAIVVGGPGATIVPPPDTSILKN